MFTEFQNFVEKVSSVTSNFVDIHAVVYQILSIKYLLRLQNQSTKYILRYQILSIKYLLKFQILSIKGATGASNFVEKWHLETSNLVDKRVTVKSNFIEKRDGVHKNFIDKIFTVTSNFIDKILISIISKKKHLFIKFYRSFTYLLRHKILSIKSNFFEYSLRHKSPCGWGEA